MGRLYVVRLKPEIGSVIENFEPELMRVADPHSGVTVIPEVIVCIGVHENVQRAVIEREPGDDLGEIGQLKRQLIGPHGMRPNRAFMETAHLQLAREARLDLLAQDPGGVAMLGVEVHVGMPTLDCRYV